MWESFLPYPVLCLLFLLSYLQFTSSLSLNSSSQSRKLCSSEESYALLNFKNSISINSSASSHCDNYAVSYPRTASWKQGSDCCSWDGVTCDTFTGHVTSLDLSSSWLLGTLEVNSSLFLLQHLRNLSLACNNFQGSRMSSNFGQFTYLTHLDLSSNNLSGVLNIDMFSKLKNLKSVYLSNNSLSLLSLASHSNVNFTLPKLEDFRCSSCNITEFPSFLKASENLKFLDLSNNSIPGRLGESELWHNMFHLDLSNNNLRSFDQISSMFLQYLDLHSNLLRGSLVPLPPTTRFISVANNKLTGEIPSSFCSFNSIEYIDLSSNSFSGMIPECLANHGELLWLNLRMNNFYGSIPQTFSMCHRLMSLKFNGNQLEGPLPQSLANCSSLQVLDAGNNRIEDSFPHWLATLPDLRILILRSNRFHGSIDDSKTRLPFPKLRILDISHNLFTGNLPTTYFKNFKAMMGHELGFIEDVQDYMTSALTGSDYTTDRTLINITYMDLSDNQFEGRIPDAVGNLDGLHALNFSHNNLKGNIPSTFGNMRDLESLDLSSNKLEGEIPSQLVNLHYLVVLNLSYNRLVGPIPQERQFAMFGDDSYIGNLGLSKQRSNDESPEPKPTILQEEPKSKVSWGSYIWNWFDWKIIMLGYGSGIVIGLSMAYIVFTTGKPWWFVSMVEREAIKLNGRNKGRRRRRN
ncbi:hypothetical protein ACOSQ4_030615 [Xanthoceras sorbifolium]